MQYDECNMTNVMWQMQCNKCNILQVHLDLKVHLSQKVHFASKMHFALKLHFTLKANLQMEVNIVQKLPFVQKVHVITLKVNFDRPVRRTSLFDQLEEPA